MAQVNITINGKVYRMACDDGEEPHLEALAARLNGTIDQLRGSFGEIGDQRLIVMAALTMGDELAEAHRRIRRLETEIAGINETKAAVIARFEEAEAGFARAIDHVAGRIESMTQKLNSGAQ